MFDDASPIRLGSTELNDVSLIQDELVTYEPIDVFSEIIESPSIDSLTFQSGESREQFSDHFEMQSQEIDDGQLLRTELNSEQDTLSVNPEEQIASESSPSTGVLSSLWGLIRSIGHKDDDEKNK